MKEGGSHKREYIIIDDGSTDNSSCTIRSMTKKLPGKVVHLKRRNMGASFSTNQAVNLANAYWIRLLDGDDLITYKSTEIMLGLAMRFKTEFVYGQMCENDNRIRKKENFNYTIQNEKQGLRKFIRNCPANSSCILFLLLGSCRVKSTNGYCCSFPFVYRGRRYTGCTRTNSRRPWCSLTGNYDKDKQYGWCPTRGGETGNEEES